MTIKYEKVKLIASMVLVYIIFSTGVWNGYPMHTSTDELGAIVSAAKLAGLDWSEVIQFSGYYGFGYYSLFFPIFKMTDNPIVIYRVIVLVTAFIPVLIIPMAFYIGKFFLKIKSESYLFALSILMPLLHTSVVGVIGNEYILEFLLWLTILLLGKVYTELKNSSCKWIYYFVLLLIENAYLLLIHTRALVILIAEVIVLVGVIIYLKRYKIIGIITIIPILYFIIKKGITVYQKIIYNVQDGEYLRNASVNISNNINILDSKTWDVWFTMIVGMISVENIITGGLFILSIVVFFVYAYHIFLCGKKENLNNAYSNMIYAFTILCIGGTMVAFLSLSWFEGMYLTWGEENAGKAYAYKGITYVRYWNLYVPPFLLASLSKLENIELKKVISKSLLLVTSVYFIFAYKVIDIIQNNSSCASFLYGVGGYTQGMRVDANYYYKCLLISLGVIFLLFIFLDKKKINLSIIVGILFMCSFHISEQTDYNLNIKDRMSSKIMSSYLYKQELDEDGIEIKEIYINDETKGTDRNWKLYSIAQFYFNRYTIHVELPKILGENDIIISTNVSKDIKSKYEDIKEYILDDNEVWYTYMDL